MVKSRYQIGQNKVGSYKVFEIGIKLSVQQCQYTEIKISIG